MAHEGIGARLPRKEDRRFITGAGNYTDDITVKNAAHAEFVRSPHAHARIVRINASAALGAPGVIAAGRPEFPELRKRDSVAGPKSAPGQASPNLLSRDLASRIIQARGVDGIARAVESIAATSFANGADRSLRAVRTAVSKDQRLLKAHGISWPVACAGEHLGLQLVEPPIIVEQRDR